MGGGARNAIRWLAAGLFAGLGSPERHARKRRGTGRWGIILRYHRVIPVEEPASYYRMGIDAALFEAQVAWLASHTRVVSLEELLRWKESREIPPEDLVVLTFDDGYRDNRTHAAPILERYRLPATFYVTSSCLSERIPFWPEVLAQLIRRCGSRELRFSIAEGGGPEIWSLADEEEKRRCCLDLIGRLRRSPMSRILPAIDRLAEALSVDLGQAREATATVMGAEDLRNLAAAGFSIGSHTVTHPYLVSEEAERQRWEIEESRRRLEEVIGRPVVDFCYPGGGYGTTTRDLVASAGYRSATTSDLGVVGFDDDPYRLPRVGVGTALASGPGGRFSASMMRAEVSGLFSVLYRSRRRRGKNA